MDGSKLRGLGWSPAVSFDEGIATTVAWYREHEAVAGRARRHDAYTSASTAIGCATAGRGRDRLSDARRSQVPRPAGRALVRALGEAPYTGPGGPLAWGRAEFDLDAPGVVGERLERDRVEVVVHAAAWTDVDACARDPHSPSPATGRRPASRARLRARGIDLIAISTNEVFDGRRTTGPATAPTTRPSPPTRTARSPPASAWPGTPTRAARPRPARDRPDSLAVRARQAGLPGEDPRRGP